MKLSLFLLVVLAIIAVFADDEISEEDKKRWQNFKIKFGKVFLSTKKETKRMKAFLAKAKAVDEHNEKFENGEVTYVQALYPHSDLTPEEFAQRYLGAKPELKKADEPKVRVAVPRQLPASWDIRNDGPGKLTGVKDQGVCGSCWTFSTTGTVENYYSIKNGILVSLSEQQQVDCVYNYDGCEGGWFSDAYDYVQSVGLSLEKYYPYSGRYGTCDAANVEKPATILSYYNIAPDVLQIKAALQNGACAVCVDATNYDSYGGGLYTDPTTNPECNHAVTLIGYGKDKTTGKNFWTIRNSWSAYWGEDGHIRVAEGDSSIFLEHVYCLQ